MDSFEDEPGSLEPTDTPPKIPRATYKIDRACLAWLRARGLASVRFNAHHVRAEDDEAES